VLVQLRLPNAQVPGQIGGHNETALNAQRANHVGEHATDVKEHRHNAGGQLVVVIESHSGYVPRAYAVVPRTTVECVTFEMHVCDTATMSIDGVEVLG